MPPFSRLTSTLSCFTKRCVAMKTPTVLRNHSSSRKMGGCVGEFTTTVTTKDVVSATLPMQKHWLPLSNLDLLLPPIDAHVIFLYKNAAQSEEDYKNKVSVLKKGLAQGLVSFYPFAGEVVNNSAGEPQVSCNNRGVDFIEAFGNVRLCDLDLYDPIQSLYGKLVPQKKDGVLSVQVTKLLCGTMVIGCTFDHRVADGYSANMFWVTWAEMATNKSITNHPSFRRSLLNPRHPTEYDTAIDDMYLPISSIKPQIEHKTENIDPFISRIYFVAAEQLNLLQFMASNCAKGACKRTKLQSFSAFLWKLVASSACQNQGALDNASKICKMGIVVDGRTRLVEGENKEKATRFSSYFGNVLSLPFGEETCGDIQNIALSLVADKVHHLLVTTITKDHFLGLIDWVEVHKPEPVISKVYSKGTEDGPAIVVSSGQRFPVSEVDFGWGKPTFGLYYFPWGGSCGYVMPMPSPSGDGDWVVYMHLPETQIRYVEHEASHVFQPFSLDLVGSN